MAIARIKDKHLKIRCSKLLLDDLKKEAKKTGQKQSYLIRLFVEGGLKGDIKIQDYTPLVNALHDLGLNMARVGGQS